MGVRSWSARRALIVLVVAGALLAPACSSDEGSEEPGSSPTTGASEAVNQDGFLRIGYDLIQNGQWSWNPGIGNSGTSMDPMWYLVYGRLMRKAADGTLIPDQAESAEVVDANTIEVKLRPDQTWSDGAPFDAAAVKAGLDSNIAAKNQGNLGADYSGVGGTVTVDVVDPTTVKINVPTNSAMMADTTPYCAHPFWPSPCVAASQPVARPRTISQMMNRTKARGKVRKI